MVVLVSGAPRAVASVAIGGEAPCPTDCDGPGASKGHEDDADEDVCPPLCTSGPCAKVFPTVASASFVEMILTSAGERELAPLGGPEDVEDGVSGSVFHPPRR